MAISKPYLVKHHLSSNKQCFTSFANTFKNAQEAMREVADTTHTPKRLFRIVGYQSGDGSINKYAVKCRRPATAESIEQDECPFMIELIETGSGLRISRAELEGHNEDCPVYSHLLHQAIQQSLECHRQFGAFGPVADVGVASPSTSAATSTRSQSESKSSTPPALDYDTPATPAVEQKFATDAPVANRLAAIYATLSDSARCQLDVCGLRDLDSALFVPDSVWTAFMRKLDLHEEDFHLLCQTVPDAVRTMSSSLLPPQARDKLLETGNFGTAASLPKIVDICEKFGKDLSGAANVLFRKGIYDLAAIQKLKDDQWTLFLNSMCPEFTIWQRHLLGHLKILTAN